MSEILQNENEFANTEEFAVAIEEGDSATVQLLIDNGLVDLNTSLPRHCFPPPLVFAVRRNQLAIVDILLRANANIDGTDSIGCTACHSISSGMTCRDDGGLEMACNYDMLTLLLAYRPNLNLTDVCGRTALQSAFIFFPNDTRFILALIEADAPIENINWLSQFATSSTTAIRALLKRGCVVRNVCTYALHYAASNSNDIAVLDLLVNVCGFDLDANDEFAGTCVHCAARNSNVVALDWLIQAGADINCRTSFGKLPLDETRDYECAISLLAAGADYTNMPIHTDLNSVQMIINALRIDDRRNAEMKNNQRNHQDVLQDVSQITMFDLSHQVKLTRRDIAKKRLDLIRCRALQVCIGLQPLGLPALQVCDILLFACVLVAPLVAPLVSYHHWWKIAKTVKHFKNE